MLRLDHRVYMMVFNVAYVGLMGSLLTVAACLPFVLALWPGPPGQAWPLLALTAPVVGPALVGLFGVFTTFVRFGDASVVQNFWRSWRGRFGRALAVGASASCSLTVLLVDIQVLAASPVGVLAVPLLVTLTILAVVVTLHALVGLAVAPEVPTRSLARASVWIGVRRWYLTLASLLALGVLAAVVVQRPAIGLGVLLAPVLYVVWWNTTTALRLVLPTVAPEPAPV